MIKLKLRLPKIVWSKREKMLAAFCVLAVSVVMIDRFAVNAWIGRMADLRSRIEGTEKMLVNQQRLMQRKDLIEGEISVFRRYLNPGAAAGTQMAAFLKELEGIARQNEIDSLEIKPQEGESNDLYRVYVFDVQAQSDYSRWIRFLHAVESSPALFEIQRARIAVKETEEGILEVYVRLTAVAFREPTG